MSLESAVVRIHGASDRVIGAGFLLAERRILTCAHVVAHALGVQEDVIDCPERNTLLGLPTDCAEAVFLCRGRYLATQE